MPALECQLIPAAEMAPGQIGAIRNRVIQFIVNKASGELGMSPEKLVVRDVRPANDLALYAGGTTTSTNDEWLYDATTTTANAFTNISGSAQMGDQRYVAIFGVRDGRKSMGLYNTAMATDPTGFIATGAATPFAQVVSFLKIIVGGSDKAIWDLNSIQPYAEPVGYSPSPVLIPQNTQYQIQFLLNTLGVPGCRALIQLIGVVVEPRGRTVTP